MTYLDNVARQLHELEQRGLRRTILPQSPYASGTLLDFSANDYLGLAQHPSVVASLNNATRVGSGGARLLAGAHDAHRRLEHELAKFVGRERALLVSSGYHAALAAIGTLANVVDSAYSDVLNHASLIDGMRLTKLKRHVYPHRSIPAIEGDSALLVTESLFGVDGDSADPARLLGTLRAHDVMLIDEAHALGVLGPHGGGLAYGLDDPRIVIMGTLSKAFGAHGGFIAGPSRLIEYMQSSARAFIFDTALPPAIAEAAITAVRIARDFNDGRARLSTVGSRLRSALRDANWPVPDGVGPIVPILIGDVDRTMTIAGRLCNLGINAPPIRPPTVPPGTSRLRVTLRATHTNEDIDRLVAALSGIGA